MLKDALAGKEFIYTCEFVPGRGMTGPALDSIIKFARECKTITPSIHAISLTDNPSGNPAISPDVIAAEVLKEGVDVLVHFSCRDINRNAMESRAMALARNNLHNLLVVTGDYSAGGYGGKASPVFDLDSVQAVRYLSEMSSGLPVPGKVKGTMDKMPGANFILAAAVSPFKTTEAEFMNQLFKLEKKVAAGANLIITQLGYNMRKSLEVKRYMDVRNVKVPLIGNVYVLSAAAGRAMKRGDIPGCVVTDELLKILEEDATAPDKGKLKRLERAAKMVAVFKGLGFAGVHIGGFGLKTDDFKFIIEQSVKLAPNWADYYNELNFGAKNEFYAFPAPSARGEYQPDKDPTPALAGGSGSFGYTIMDIFHKMMFTKSSVLYKLGVWYYKLIGEKGILYSLSHFNEHVVKGILLGCRDCGDCAIAEMAYCCPMSKCAKMQRNGPCGGSVDGTCEVYPGERPCVWSIVYERMKGAGKLEEIRDRYVLPRKCELAFTSGWANFYLEKDHTAAPKEETPSKAAH